MAATFKIHIAYSSHTNTIVLINVVEVDLVYVFFATYA